MANIFEHPWALLGFAIGILFVTLIIRMIFPEKRHWRQLAIPFFLIVAAFGLDFFVKTDMEKIKTTIKTATTGLEQEKADLVEVLISDNYQDSRHRTKKQLMRHCRNKFSSPVVEKAITRIVEININERNADAIFTVNIVFDPQSQLYDYQRIMLVRVIFKLQKEADNGWLIKQIEILEVNKQPFKWGNIR